MLICEITICSFFCRAVCAECVCAPLCQLSSALGKSHAFFLLLIAVASCIPSEAPHCFTVLKLTLKVISEET